MGLRRLLQLSSFRAFAHPGFGALWTGALVSNIGSWMSTVALGVAVTQHTGKASWTGAVAAMTFIPAVLLAPIAGALADRFERRRYLMILNALQIGVAGLLAALSFAGALSVGWMGALAFVAGCAGTLSNPAFVALIGELVPPESLPTAFSLNSAQFNLGRIVGPALATIVLAVGGAPWAFALNAASFLAVLYALSKLPVSLVTRDGPPLPLWQGIREGLEHARRDPGIRLSLASVFAVALFVAPFIGMIPVYALKVFGRGAETASLFTTAQGIGAVMLALSMGPLVGRFGLRKVAVMSSQALGLVAIAYWMAPTPGVAAVVIAVLGAAYLSTLSTFHTVEQLRAPRGAQARISSLHSMVLGGGYALGLVVLGALADSFGLRVVLGSSAAVFAVLVLVARLFATRGIEALEPAVQPSEPQPAPVPAAR